MRNDSSSYCDLFGGDFNLIPSNWRSIDPYLGGFKMVPVLGRTQAPLAKTSFINQKKYVPEGQYGSNPFDMVLYMIAAPATAGVPNENQEDKNNYGVFDFVYDTGAGPFKALLTQSLLDICNDWRLYTKAAGGLTSCNPLVAGRFLAARFISDHLPIYLDVGGTCKRRWSSMIRSSRPDVPYCCGIPFSLMPSY